LIGHRAEILEGALAAAFDDGLSQLTFGRLANRLGISDRIVVYYFPSKADLVGDVIGALGTRLQQTLAPVLVTRATDHIDLLKAVWPVIATPDADAVFALFFEANGLATAGREPYRTLVQDLVTMWITWAAELIVGTPQQRRTEAESAIALIDGLLLLRLLAGPEAAQRVAQRIGIV
jgi:AcrR family transcriptional regulator